MKKKTEIQKKTVNALKEAEHEADLAKQVEGQQRKDLELKTLEKEKLVKELKQAKIQLKSK